MKCGEFSDKAHAYFLLLRERYLNSSCFKHELFNESNKLLTFCSSAVYKEVAGIVRAEIKVRLLQQQNC